MTRVSSTLVLVGSVLASLLLIACSDPAAKTAPTISSAASALTDGSATPVATGVSTALPTSPELLARVASQFKPPCKLRRACGDLLGIDCNSAADGPFYYVNAESLAIVSTCGGACMGGRCTNCPPKEWTCQ